MARARNIKPSIMDNEELTELDHSCRLLFIYLWMLVVRGTAVDVQTRKAQELLGVPVYGQGALF